MKKENNILDCPCCGYCTLSERGNDEICPVCWWQDDGQNNKNANEVLGGPNDEISLTQGRYNFLRFGFYNPKRKDLIESKESTSKYERARAFEVIGIYVIEKETNWKGKINKDT